ncbi:hypothetical protein [Nocardioides stalactiti]|uniref:hypothetical protein n=1 Tax=Nocardioides stalactiti TaxID=2755356 RepID=UPI00160283E6|nr:hypothetical protein [Nocardioides stalactiti]
MPTEGEVQAWLRLVARLDEWAVSAVASGLVEIHVTLPDREGEVVLHLSPRDWSGLAGTIWGSDDRAFEQVRDALAAQPDDLGHLVHRTYALHPSATPELPEDPEQAWIREQLRQHPEGFGTWFAYGRDGTMEFPFPEPPPREAADERTDRTQDPDPGDS